VWNAPKKLAILKQLQIHFKAKHEKGVGTPFPRVPAPLHPCINGVSPLPQLVSVEQKNRPLTMLSLIVQSIVLPMERMT